MNMTDTFGRIGRALWAFVATLFAVTAWAVQYGAWVPSVWALKAMLWFFAFLPMLVIRIFRGRKRRHEELVAAAKGEEYKRRVTLTPWVAPSWVAGLWRAV